MSTLNVKAFIEKMKDDSFRNQVGPSLSKVKEGDWNAVCEIAAQHGFQFSVEDLKAEAKNYPGFFKGAGKVPDSGWDKQTLKEA